MHASTLKHCTLSHPIYDYTQTPTHSYPHACTHAHYVCGFAWSDMVPGCMVYTERAETVAVSCGTNHASAVSRPLRWIFKTAPGIEKLVSRVKLHASAVSLFESGEYRCVKAINNIRCVRLCLFSALSPMVGALEIPIITITSFLAGK